MQNVYKQALKKKNNLLESLSKENKNYFKIKETLKNGNIVYLQNKFSFDKFVNNLNIFLQNTLKLKSSIIELQDNFVEIKYKSNINIASKINANTNFSVLMFCIDNIICFYINPTNYFEESVKKKLKFNITSLINDSYKKEISQFIFETIYNKHVSALLKKTLNFENSFIEHTHINERLFLLSLDKQIILSKLNLSNFKIKNKEISEQVYNSSFVVTENSIIICAFNKNGEILIFEGIKDNFKIKKGITSNTIKYSNFSWNTKRSNSKLFNLLKNIQKYSGNNRIKEFARLNYLVANYKFAYYLISETRAKENNIEYDFLYLLTYLKSNSSANISDEEIKPLIQNILSEEKINKKIVEILNSWKVSNIEKVLLLDIFTKTADSKNERKAIIPLFDVIRTEFKRKNKDLINQTVFEINYAEFLILSGKNRRARKILKNLLKKLPNEEISDILPSQDLDLTSNKSGQLLKIKIFELLTIAKGKDEAEDEILQSVILQPLNIKILKKLQGTKNRQLNKKANEIISLLRQGGLINIKKEVPVKKYNILPQEVIETKFRHPATLKSGSFYSFQKWISKIKADDYSSVKEYSEKIDATNYPKLNEIFYNLKQIFKLKEIEYYISRGKKSHEIIGYEGTPPFILIGYKHLDKNSNLFLNFKELQFAISVELAHIYFKHSKISANDVWRGVADKGYILLDAVLGIIPVAGLASKSIHNANKLSGLTKILNNSISVGKNVYETANKVSKFYKNKININSKTNKKQKLLVASRLMQYTADRAGLATSGDIKSAIRTIFLTSKYNYAFFNDVIETSLNEFILQKGEDGKYKNQEIALRVAHLISFYFSNEYSEIRALLLGETR